MQELYEMCMLKIESFGAANVHCTAVEHATHEQEVVGLNPARCLHWFSSIAFSFSISYCYVLYQVPRGGENYKVVLRYSTKLIGALEHLNTPKVLTGQSNKYKD